MKFNFLISYFDQLRSGSFFKSFLTLVSGVAIAQIIPTLISPVLSRLYFPEHFGLLATYTSVTAILISISTLQFESAIVLPKKRGEAKLMLGLSLMLPLALGLLAMIGIFLGNKALANMLNLGSAGWLFYLMPIFVIAGGWYNAMAGYFLREKQFKTLTLRQIGMSFSTAVSKLILGFLKVVQVGLILGTLIGQLTSLSIFSYQLFKNERIKSFLPTRIVAKKLLNKYIDFAKYTTWQGFFDTISVAAVLWVFNEYLTLEQVGLYAFTLAIVQKPVSLVGGQIGRLYLLKLSEGVNNQINLRSFSRKLFLALLVFSIFIFTPLILNGENIFGFVFGDEWLAAGEVFLSMSPMIIMKFAFSPFTSVPQVYERQRIFFIIGVIYNFLPPLAYVLFFQKLKMNFLDALLVVSILNVCFNLLILIWFDNLITQRVISKTT